MCQLIPVRTHVVITRPQLTHHAGADAGFLKHLTHRRSERFLAAFHGAGRHLNARHGQRVIKMAEYQKVVILHYVTDDLLNDYWRHPPNLGRRGWGPGCCAVGRTADPGSGAAVSVVGRACSGLGPE
ncbi:hypothetical protein MMM2322_02311 [Microbacterium sp. MM2322]